MRDMLTGFAEWRATTEGRRCRHIKELSRLCRSEDACRRITWRKRNDSVGRLLDCVFTAKAPKLPLVQCSVILSRTRTYVGGPRDKCPTRWFKRMMLVTCVGSKAVHCGACGCYLRGVSARWTPVAIAYELLCMPLKVCSWTSQRPYIGWSVAH